MTTILVIDQSGEPEALLRATLPASLPRPLAIQARSEWLGSLSAGVEASALMPFAAADRLIGQARKHAAELDEASALRDLAEAEASVRSALHVPGAAAFYAEVQLQLGVVAAQSGLTGLAQAAFARAARLDPGRRLLAGEAAPDVALLAARVFDAAVAAPSGEVQIVSEPAGAHVFVDDIERGTTPFTLRAQSGVHALRIEAPLRATYASLFELAEGRRPVQHFVLCELPRAAAAVRLAALANTPASAAAAEAAQELLAVAPELAAVTWAERDALHARSLRYVCERAGCRTPLRVQQGRIVSASDAHAPITLEALAAARNWLHAVSAPREPGAAPASVWQRWYVWSGLAAVLVAGGALAVAFAQPPPQRMLSVRVDPGDLR